MGYRYKSASELPKHIRAKLPPQNASEKNAKKLPKPKLTPAQKALKDALRKAKELTSLYDAQQKRLAPDLPAADEEYKFAVETRGRHWRFDRAYTPQRVAVELDGGTTQGSYRGRHNSPEGYRGDSDKLDEAAAQGWVVLRFTGAMLKEDPAGCLALVRRALNSRLQSG